MRADMRCIALAAITPLLEKNVLKTLNVDVPVVFSMSRLVVLAFATGVMRQLWSAGIAGWPDATFAIAVVLALPILGALDRVAPERVVDVLTALIGRVGIGETRRVANVYADAEREPSKFDDHRID